MYRTLPLLLILLAFLYGITKPATLAFATPQGSANTESQSPEKLYKQAKFYFNQLETNDQLSAKRGNWVKGTLNFRRIYLANPKSDYAPACIFMLGRMHSQMYTRFQTQADLDGSINYYNDIARMFPNHRLADDSFYAIGLIYLNEKDDPKTAATYFSMVVKDYPGGDMHPFAADLMKQLSRDHDIPLPNIMVGNSKLSNLNYVLPVKYWSSDNYTRVVVMASGPVNYREELLEKTKDQPRRLYIDFQQSYIEPQYRAPVPIEDGLLKRIRTGQFNTEIVRVVLDIESIDSYKIYSLPDPFRVVIDVRGETETEEQYSHAKPPPSHPSIQIDIDDELQSKAILNGNKKSLPRRTPVLGETGKSAPSADKGPVLSLAQQLGLGVKRIVLDPGHGGKDPGAIANGLKEKDIVLRLAKELQTVLAKDIGCEVLLTRDDDSFISLEERTAIANTRGADLFVSLHINAHPSPEVSGLETYYLNLSTNAEAMRVAARENAISTHQMSELQDILSDILKTSKIKESSRLANQVHESILSGLTEKDFGKIRNLGVKQAPFYVLIGAEMPAILIEIAFISNEQEAKNLQSAEYIAALAKEISVGIQGYVNMNTALLDTMFQ